MVSRSRGTRAFSRDGGTGSSDEHLLDRLRRRLRPERRPAREQLVEDRPQGVDVRGRPDRAASRPGPARGPCSSASPAGPRSGSAPARSSSRRARPKSVILGVPSAVSRTLAGFRSRWTIPPRCAASTASASVASSAAASRAGRGVPASFWARLPPSTILHREVRPAVQVADVVDLHDVRVPQRRHRLAPRAGSAPAPPAGRRGRPGASSGRRCGRAAGAAPGRRRPSRRGPAPPAPRSRGCCGSSAVGRAVEPDAARGLGRGKQRVELACSTSRSRCSPARTCGSSSGHERQTSSGLPPDSSSSSISCVHARVVDHRRASSRSDRRVGGDPAPSPAVNTRAVQPPLHRLDRDAQDLGGLGLRQPLDPHQVEHLALVLRQAVDRLQHAAAVRASARSRCWPAPAPAPRTAPRRPAVHLGGGPGH